MPPNTLASVETITDQERAIFERPTHALIEVTDVGDGPTEFDALCSIMVRHLRPLQDQVFSMAESGILKYAADFAAGLPAMAQDRIDRAKDEANCYGRSIPADVEQAESAWETKTLRWVDNYAPRNQKRSEHKNGRDFYLGLANEVEIYAVPVVTLQYLRTRGLLDALFRVPTDGHPLMPEGEQFRSSVIGKTAHEAPNHLQLIWRRGMDEKVLDKVLPNLKTPEVAFIDQPYNNRRIITPSLARTIENIDEAKQCDGSVVVQVGKTRLRVYKAVSLADVPEGQWGLWHNPADGEEQGAGYIELSRRWDEEKDWTGRGQFPSAYLRRCDRHIGAPFKVLPKDSRVDPLSALQQFVGKFGKKSY